MSALIHLIFLSPAEFVWRDLKLWGRWDRGSAGLWRSLSSALRVHPIHCRMHGTMGSIFQKSLLPARIQQPLRAALWMQNSPRAGQIGKGASPQGKQILLLLSKRATLCSCSSWLGKECNRELLEQHPGPQGAFTPAPHEPASQASAPGQRVQPFCMPHLHRASTARSQAASVLL